MRPSFVRAFALLAAAGCSSAALGQQFNIADPDIVDSTYSFYSSSYSGPSAGGFDYAGAVNDGGNDAFDTWMYPNSSLGGLSLFRRVDTLNALNVYRHIDTYTNNTAGPLTVPLSTYGNLGSDGNETFVRNDAFAQVTHDGVQAGTPNDPGYDPVVGLMNGNNVWTLANITRSNFYDDVNINYTLTLQPGESITLMWATFLALDYNDRPGDLTLAMNTVNAMLADPAGTGLYTGLTATERDSIVNWSVPTPGAAALLGLGALASLRRRR